MNTLKRSVSGEGDDVISNSKRQTRHAAREVRQATPRYTESCQPSRSWTGKTKHACLLTTRELVSKPSRPSDIHSTEAWWCHLQSNCTLYTLCYCGRHHFWLHLFIQTRPVTKDTLLIVNEYRTDPNGGKHVRKIHLLITCGERSTQCTDQDRVYRTTRSKR